MQNTKSTKCKLDTHLTSWPHPRPSLWAASRLPRPRAPSSCRRFLPWSNGPCSDDDCNGDDDVDDDDDENAANDDNDCDNDDVDDDDDSLLDKIRLIVGQDCVDWYDLSPGGEFELVMT